METPKEEKVKSRIPSCGCLMLIGIILIVLSIIIAYQRLKPNMVLAIYYNRDIPVINDIRTKVELYRYEHDSLPGVPIDAETGKPIVNSSGYSTSHLPDSAVAAGANCLQWMLTEGTESDTNEAMREVLVCDGKILDNPTGHVWRQLDIHYEDLMSGGHDPHYMQYAAIMSSSNAYYLVVGCFGYGRGLPAGTGYAVAEYNDQANKRKFVATFEHYKPIASIPMSIHVGPMDHEGGKTIDRKTMLKAGKVFLPTAEMLLTDYSNAIKAMRDFGWDVY